MVDGNDRIIADGRWTGVGFDGPVLSEVDVDGRQIEVNLYDVDELTIAQAYVDALRFVAYLHGRGASKVVVRIESRAI